MAKVRVIKAFRLNAPDGRQLEFQEGAQQIDDDLVSHWFVQAHIEAEEAQEAKPEAGSPTTGPSAQRRKRVTHGSSSLSRRLSGVC